MKTFSFLICTLFLSFLLASCNNPAEKKEEIFSADSLANAMKPTEVKPETIDKIADIWLQMDTKGKIGQDGFNLHEDGTANSINMATLLYEKWQRIGNDSLVLTGKSMGNKQTLEFSDTFKIAILNDTMLELHKNKLKLMYHRE